MRILWACGGLALLGLIALVVAVYATRQQIPSFDELKSSPNGQMIRVHAADGTVIASLGPSYGEWLSYDQIPKVMRDATVSVEDRRFRSHIGVDPIGVLRALKFAFVNRDTDRRFQGASTITQQVARTIFLSNRYSIRRKFREAILALALERKFTKDQILELYMNKVYYGGGAYGIDAAARKFFGHSAKQLTLGEAAVIAGLVKAPSHYSPTADAEAAIGRAGVVLQLMQETGAITAQQAAEADVTAVKLAPEPKQNSVRYFTDWALPQLETLIDENSRPLEVYTTLDPTDQAAAEQAIANATPIYGAARALVSTDTNTGAIIAMASSQSYDTSQFNLAATGERQPGSAFKPFVLTTARNILINRVRREQVVPIEAVADLESLGAAADEPPPDRAVMAREELRRLQLALDHLPPRSREAVVMKQIEGLSRRDIATRMGVGEETVKRHLTNGMRALADFLYGEPTDLRRKP